MEGGIEGEREKEKKEEEITQVQNNLQPMSKEFFRRYECR